MNKNLYSLDNDEIERLVLLCEELAEAQQAIMKIMRHGYESYNPLFPEKTNRQDLEKELGHVSYAIKLMIENHDILQSEIDNNCTEKSLSIACYLHHQQTL